MYKIVTKQELARNLYLIKISAPDVAKKSNPGQFVIIRPDEKGERVPLTIAGVDLENGTVATAFHVVGRTTKKLTKLNVGDSVMDLSGPLGNPAKIEKFGKILLVGGGVWCAPLYYVATALRKLNNNLVTVAAGRTENDLIYETELKQLVGKGGLAEEQKLKEKEIEKLKKRLDYAQSIDDPERRSAEMTKIKLLIVSISPVTLMP